MTHVAWGCLAQVAPVLADWPPGIIIPLFILAMIILATVGMYAAAQRRKELAAWAVAHGLVFDCSRTDRLESDYPLFGCLQQGHSRYAYNLIHGRWADRGVLGFDYHYVTGHGKNRRTHHFSAVILESRVQLQPLLIRPEHLFDKMSAFFGFDDIDFESAEFSQRFFVKAANKRWAYDVLHPRAMEHLLAHPPFTIQFEPRCAICYRDRTFKPADFEAACQVVCGLLDQLPEYVARQQGAMKQGEA